jgi:hypothetical protein
VQWRINVGWFLESLQPAFFVAAIALTVLILIGRREGWQERALAIAALTITLIAISTSIVLVKRRFIDATSARAELEARLGLNSRLSAAAAGVCPWPARQEWRGGLWKWQWRRLWLLPVVSSALVIAAFNIPLPGVQQRSSVPVVKPPALAAVEEWIEELQQNQSIDQKSLEPLQEQVEQLAAQEPAEWYSHASLEAADHLQSQIGDGMQALSQNAAAVKGLLGIERSLSETETKRWKEQMETALDAMDGNTPALNRALAQQLRELDASNLRSLTPEQIGQLQKAMNELRKGANRHPGEGNGEGDGDREDGEGETGQGGVDRGPGHPPLSLGANETDLKTDKSDPLQSADFSRASLGDLAGTSDGQHQVDKAAEYRAAQGGAAASPGAGPDAVWIQQSLPPEERQRLRQFYQ